MILVIVGIICFFNPEIGDMRVTFGHLIFVGVLLWGSSLWR